MSQIYKSLTSGPVPPAVPTQFTADDGSIGVPVANNFNLLSNFTSANNNNGIQTTTIANGSANHYTQLTNRIQNVVTTTNATPAAISTFALGATPGVYTFDINIAGYDVTDNEGVGYSIFGTIRTTGASGVVIGTPDKIVNEETSPVDLSPADVALTVSGNNAIVQVTGLAATTIHWNSIATYIKVT